MSIRSILRLSAAATVIVVSAGFPAAAGAAPANQVPVANPDNPIIRPNTTAIVPAPGVLGNDTDADGDPLTAALVTGVTNGALMLNADGSFTYTPPPGSPGEIVDTFTYTASDGTATSAPTIVRLQTAAISCIGQPQPGSIVGTKGDDTLNGTPGSDMIYGLGGNDVISGFAGNDIVCGNDGNDILSGGDGNDIVKGDAGNDTLFGGAGDDTLNGGRGTNTLDGGPGDDDCRSPARGLRCP